MAFRLAVARKPSKELILPSHLGHSLCTIRLRRRVIVRARLLPSRVIAISSHKAWVDGSFNSTNDNGGAGCGSDSATRSGCASPAASAGTGWNRSSPRATLNGFIDACNKIYQVIHQREHGIKKTPEYEHLEDRLLRCLDLSQQPDYLRDYAGKEAAICLKEVLDRIELPPDDTVPDIGAVRTEPEANPLDRWTVPHTEITIARVTEGPRQGEFLFSPETLERAVTYYERVKHLPYRSDHHEPTRGFYDFFLSEPSSPTLATLVLKLPNWTKSRVFGQTVWQWVALLLTIVISALLMVYVYLLGHRFAERTRASSVLRYSLTLVFPIVAMFVPWIAGGIIEEQLAISGWTLIVTKFVGDLASLLALLVAVVGSGSRLAEIIIAHPRVQPQGLDAQFTRVVCRVLSIAAAIIILLEGGRHLGIPPGNTRGQRRCDRSCRGARSPRQSKGAFCQHDDSAGQAVSLR